MPKFEIPTTSGVVVEVVNGNLIISNPGCDDGEFVLVENHIIRKFIKVLKDALSHADNQYQEQIEREMT